MWKGVNTTPPEEYEGDVYELADALMRVCIRREEQALEEDYKIQFPHAAKVAD